MLGVGKDRVKLSESVSELSFPSKEFHKRLANLDENTFSSGNLRGTHMSKNVIKQCAYEYRESSLEDKDVIRSIQLLQQKFSEETQSKSTSGFIQFFSINPFAIGLWTEKDIELYHKMSSSHSLLVDATGSIATKLTDKEIFYFAFFSYDRSIQTEPVPHLELLTDLSTTNTLKFIFMRFLEDEMKRFNYISFSVPLLCTTDFSWPIIKSLVEALNNESVETYLGRSYLIVTGKATVNDLPVKTIKTFLHISLCHSMKALARKVNKCFKAERNFVKYCLSLLVNSCSLSDAFCVLTNLFKLLLYKFSDDCTNAKSVLYQKVQSDMS